MKTKNSILLKIPIAGPTTLKDGIYDALWTGFSVFILHKKYRGFILCASRPVKGSLHKVKVVIKGKKQIICIPKIKK